MIYKQIAAALVVAALCTCCVSPPPFDEAAWREKSRAPDAALLYAPHINAEGAFFNPWLERETERRGGFGMWFFRKKLRFPYFPEERYQARENDYVYLSDPNNNSISFAGHASVILKMDGETIFTDPFFSNRALVLGKKVKIPFNFDRVPPGSVVLISHNHYDHLDAWTIKQLIQKEAVFVVPRGLREFFTERGAAEVYELDWWEVVTVGNVTYTFVPAQHWSRRIGQKRNATLWGGFIVQGSKTIYFSGDTGYFPGFAEFGREWNIDYALLGAGAYEPRGIMHYQHMNIAEFFTAADDLRAKMTIPIHFGVISLSDEPLVYPLYEIDEHIAAHREYAGRIRGLRVGEYLSW
jgi:L-ascorbate metabolism protein UlaG (beta-lactamase superfamily)